MKGAIPLSAIAPQVDGKGGSARKSEGRRQDASTEEKYAK